MRRIALLPVMPLALVACGGAGRSSPATVKLVRAAFSKTASAPSFHLALSIRDCHRTDAVTGDADNIRHIVRVSGSNSSTAGLSLTAYYAGSFAYYNFAGVSPWSKVDVSRLSRLQGGSNRSPLQPHFLRDLVVQRAVELSPSRFHVWATISNDPMFVQLSNGYVRQLRYTTMGATVTLTLSRFGEPLHITLPHVSKSSGGVASLYEESKCK